MIDRVSAKLGVSLNPCDNLAFYFGGAQVVSTDYDGCGDPRRNGVFKMTRGLNP